VSDQELTSTVTKKQVMHLLLGCGGAAMKEQETQSNNKPNVLVERVYI
jgi:hypothetical protein